MNPKKLSNAELLDRVKALAASERAATSALVSHLAELDQRRLYLAEGCSSLFTYCTQVLHLSEHAAYGRIEAARAARRFPIVLEKLEDGSVNLTTVTLLAAFLTTENHQRILGAASHKSRRQVEEILAHLRPQPPIPASVRRLPTPRSSEVSAEHAPATRSEPGSPMVTPAPPIAAPPPQSRPVVCAQAPQRYKVQFTATAATVEKLRRAQALLRHQIPDGDPAAIFDLALTALLQNLAKRKLAATDRPRESRGTASGSRHIPAAVKRTVWSRDGGRCAFVSQSGRQCTEVGFLEFHHVTPYAAGGEASVENIQLRCRVHNGHEADLYLGLQGAREKRAVYSVVRRRVVTRTRSRPSGQRPARRSRSSRRRRSGRTAAAPDEATTFDIS